MSQFRHGWEIKRHPERVVVLGASGFIGKTLCRSLKQENVHFLPLGRDAIDLTARGADEKLALLLKPTDALVFLSTITPDKGRGIDAFVQNIHMAENVCKALSKTPPAHLIYLSSDTAYPIHRGLISEESPTDPENLFGVMHLARESMLRSSTSAATALLRSTLVYGAEDTHNSYGPNRLRRMAQKEGKMTLFGGGEESRDHILVTDVAALILQTLVHRSSGVLNACTGQSISYIHLAQKIAALFDHPIDILCTPRNNPITHRHFDVSLIYKAFPSFSFTPLEEGLKITHKEEFAQPMRK